MIAPSSTSENNVWSVALLDGYTIEEVKVFDRWGNVVYSVTGIGYHKVMAMPQTDTSEWLILRGK